MRGLEQCPGGRNPAGSDGWGQALQEMAGSGRRRFAAQHARFGSAAPFERHAATLPDNPVSGMGAVLNEQTGQLPSGGFEHTDAAGRTYQNGPVAIG
jgi:hypothetical protein